MNAYPKPMLDSLTTFMQPRRVAADLRQHLAANGQLIWNELERITANVQAIDPVTNRPFLSIAKIDGSPYWGAQVTLYNRHFLRFEVDESGLLFTQSSAPTNGHFHKQSARYDDVYSSSNTREVNLWTAGMGQPLRVMLDAFVEAAHRLPEYVAPREKE